MAMPVGRKLNGKQKAATLLIAMGPELSSQVLKHLSDDDIERVTLEILNMERVTSDVQDEVLEECYELCLAQEYINSGGVNYAMDLLAKTVGPTKANSIMDRITTHMRMNPFSFARTTDPAQLAQFVANEHPQAIALILAHLNPPQAANVLKRLDPSLQAEVATRVATMDRTPPEVIEQVEDVLKRKMASVITGDYSQVGGVECLVKVLNQSNRATEKTILDSVEQTMPDLAEEIKKHLFVFENIAQMDDRSIQRVLRDVESRDLTMALKGSSDEVRKCIFKNMSTRAAEMLKEDMEAAGPIRLRSVEEAQQRIVNIIRRLEEAEEIIVARGAESEIYL
jgi:flagellar motor switch protein FliG